MTRSSRVCAECRATSPRPLPRCPGPQPRSAIVSYSQDLPGRRALPPHPADDLCGRDVVLLGGTPTDADWLEVYDLGCAHRARRRAFALDRDAVLRLLDDGARGEARRGRHREDARAAPLGDPGAEAGTRLSSSTSTPTASSSTLDDRHVTRHVYGAPHHHAEDPRAHGRAALRARRDATPAARSGCRASRAISASSRRSSTSNGTTVALRALVWNVLVTWGVVATYFASRLSRYAMTFFSGSRLLRAISSGVCPSPLPPKDYASWSIFRFRSAPASTSA